MTMESPQTMLSDSTTVEALPMNPAEEAGTLPLTRRSPLWKRTLPFIVAGCILAYLFWHIDYRQCLVALTQADLFIYVPWLLAFIVITFLLDTQNLVCLLKQFNYHLPFQDALSIRGGTYLIANIDYSLGLGALIYYLKRDLGIPVMRSTGLMVIFNAINQQSLLIMSIFGLLLLSPLNTMLQNFLWVCFAIIIFDITFIQALKVLPSRGLIKKFKDLNIIKVFPEAPWKSYGILNFWRIIFYSIFIIFFHFALQAFHMSIPLVPLIAYVPIILLIVSLPIAPCGFGTAQAAMLFLFKDYGTSVNILAFGLTYSTSVLVFRSLIGLFYSKSITGLVPDKTAIQ